LRTSIIQFCPNLGDIAANTQKVSKLINTVNDADLIVLPELANTGYNFKDKEYAFSLASYPEESTYIEMLVKQAKKNNQFIVTGFNELHENKLYNSSLLVTKDGIAGKYRKVHLFMKEKSIFESGNLGFPVFDLLEYKLGMLICFDYLFPEAWRIMGLKGADIIAHPSNLITENAYRVVPAQAIMNRFFVFTANRIGTERDLTFNGKSFATDPSGNIMNRASDNRETIFSFDIDPLQARDKFITPLNHVLNDRFPEKYNGIIE